MMTNETTSAPLWPTDDRLTGIDERGASLPAGQWWLWFTVLIGFALFTCLAGVGSGPVMGDHECIVAQSARQAIEDGRWLIPHQGEIPLIRKTPLGVWLTAATARLVDGPDGRPVSQFSAHLPSGLAGVGTALVVCWLGTMLYGSRAGLVAGFIWAGSVAAIFHSRNAQVDMLLTLLTAATFACFWRGAMHTAPSKRFMIAFYPVFAAAMMAKAPLPMAIVGLSLAAYWFLTVPIVGIFEAAAPAGAGSFLGQLGREAGQQYKRLPRLWFIPGTILFVVLAGAWPLYALLSVDNAMLLWNAEYLDRLTGELSDHSRPFFYYVPIVFGLTAPFMLSVPEAMAAPFLRRYRSCRPGLAFAFTWAIVGTAFLSIPSFKRPHYLLSVIPAYCLLLAPVIDRLFFGAVDPASRRVRLACKALPIAIGAGLLAGGVAVQREYPTLVPIYVVLAVVLAVIWTGACWAYARGWRTAAFAKINLGMLVVVALAWPAAGRHLDLDPEMKALIQGFREHGLTTDDEIYLVGGRPDASVMFYSGYPLRRLMNELEMAKLRTNRRTITQDLQKAHADRIREKMTQAQPAYLVITAGRYGLLQRETDIATRVVFALSGFHELPSEEIVVITQPTTPARTTASRPG